MSTPQMTAAGFPVSGISDIQQVAPAAFANHEDPARSERYDFVPTDYFVDLFNKLGWKPTHAKQDGTSPYSRHHIRMINPNLEDLNIHKDIVKPQTIFDNSHNGSSPAQLHIGLFRTICSNGLVISVPGMYTNIKFRHIGIEMSELEELMIQVVNQYSDITPHINGMRDVMMNQDDKEEFAVSAIANRNPEHFINEDGTINEKAVREMRNPLEITKPIRSEDMPNDLWSVFNVVQERMIKGRELYNWTNNKGRQVSARPITNATRNVEYNRKLWEIAEGFMA